MISKKILEYKETGVFDSIMKKWMHTKCISQGAASPTSQEYRIAHFTGLLILLSCISIFTLILLLIECWISTKIKKTLDYSLENT